LGYEEGVRLLLSNNKPQRYYIRVNPLKTDIDSLSDYLEEHGVRVARTPVDDILKVLEYKAPITRLEWYKEGYFVIQDLANTGEIIAVDYSLERLRKMETKMKRLGVKNVKLVHADGIKFKDKEKFDKIILDAPCSSSGTYRQFPEVKWRFNKEKIKKVIQVQKAMIRNAYKNLRDEGEMTYSTCSIRIDENEENVKYAIEKVGFELINYPFTWGERGFAEIRGKVFRSFTHLHDCNSFFIAKLKR